MAQRHDRLVRTLLGAPQRMAGLLQPLLPDALAALVDWPTLRVEEATAHGDGHERRADLILSVDTRGGPGLAFLVVFEHQSSHDPDMALRFLGAMLALWRSQRRAQQPLKPVVPVLLANAPTPWRAATRLAPLFDLPAPLLDAMRDVIPDFGYLVDDLTGADELAMLAHPGAASVRFLRYALRVDRRGHDPALTPRWAEVFLDTQRHDPEALVEILRYIFASERGAQALDDLQRHEPVKDIAMTKYTEMIELARRQGLEQGVAKGIEQGVAQGIEQGVAKGIEEGLAQGALRALHAQREALRALITARFGVVDANVGDAIATADASTLSRWLPRVLTAATPKDVIGD